MFIKIKKNFDIFKGQMSHRDFNLSISTSDTSEEVVWSAIVTNAEFLLNEVQNESFAEQLRERARYFKEKGWERDFWIVPEPAWLEKKFPTESNVICRPRVALVSTNPKWITY